MCIMLILLYREQRIRQIRRARSSRRKRFYSCMYFVKILDGMCVATATNTEEQEEQEGNSKRDEKEGNKFFTCYFFFWISIFKSYSIYSALQVRTWEAQGKEDLVSACLFIHILCKLLHSMYTATIASRLRKCKRKERKKCIPTFTCYYFLLIQRVKQITKCQVRQVCQ